jgi:hypothetical protein
VIELTPDIRDEILRDLRKTRAPARTSKNTGYAIRLVLQVQEEDNHPRPFREEKYGGLGRPELQGFTVARKRPWELWDNNSEAVFAARAQYEAGTHEMTTGRDGDWLILYSIPRKKIAPHRMGYFLPENMA